MVVKEEVPYVPKHKLKWTPFKLEVLCKQMIRAGKSSCSVAEIAIKVKIPRRELYKIATRHPLIRRTLDLCRELILSKAWKNGFTGIGFPNILTRAISYHDKEITKKENKVELELHDAKEASKAKYHNKNPEPVVVIQERVVYEKEPEKPIKKSLS